MSLKTKLAAGELVRVFCAGRIPHPLVIEMFALGGGYDGFWIDQEHAAVTYEHVVGFALAARANALDCFVRMAPTGYSQVTQNLEAGGAGRDGGADSFAGRSGAVRALGEVLSRRRARD